LAALVISGQLDKESYDRVKDVLDEYRYLLDYGKSVKLRVANVLVRLIGVRLSGKVMDWVYKCRIKD
jgi:hypothetical protein